MPGPAVAPYTSGAAGGYDKHIPAIRELLSTLPQFQHYTTFPGGFVIKLNPEHYVAVLMPPIGVAEESLLTYLGDYFDGEWVQSAIETFGMGAGQVVVWHMNPPWAS